MAARNVIVNPTIITHDRLAVYSETWSRMESFVGIREFGPTYYLLDNQPDLKKVYVNTGFIAGNEPEELDAVLGVLGYSFSNHLADKPGEFEKILNEIENSKRQAKAYLGVLNGIGRITLDDWVTRVSDEADEVHRHAMFLACDLDSDAQVTQTTRDLIHRWATEGSSELPPVGPELFENPHVIAAILRIYAHKH
jgi:hypothetical protein